MTARRSIQIAVELPELAPTQVHFLWRLLDDLAADLWDAYEPELLALEEERSREVELDHWAYAECDDLVAPPPVSDDANSDF